MIFRHDEIRDELVNLASKALTPSAARNEPLIHSRADESRGTLTATIANQSADKEAATGENKQGDSSIRGFWKAVTDCTLDVQVTDADSKSCCKRTPLKARESEEREKKRKHLRPCLESR